MRNLLKSKFNLAILISLFVLTFLIVIFILLGTFTSPHIRFQTLEGSQNSAEIVSQRMKIYFSTPMNKSNTAEYIEIEPVTKFTAAWSNNTLFIIFKENLQSESEYKVTIAKDLKDIYERPLNNNFEYSFKTKEQKIAYIETNNTNNKDMVVLNNSRLSSPKTLFESEDIELFSLNSNYLAVVTLVNKVSNLKIMNLKTNEVKSLNYPDSLIGRLDFSPVTNEIIFLTQKVLREATYVLPQQEMAINIVNLDSGESKEMENSTTSFGIIEIKYAPDGNSFLYKTADSYYYVAEVSDPEKYTLIGRYLSDGGFNQSGDKIIFVNFDPLQTYSQAQFLLEFNADRTTRSLTSGDIPILDPQFLNNSSDILTAERNTELDSTKGLFKIIKVNQDGTKTDVLVDDNESLELPKISFDDRYIAIEKYAKSDLVNFQSQRNLGFQTKPSTATLIIFDIKEKKLIESSVSGINAVWVK